LLLRCLLDLDVRELGPEPREQNAAGRYTQARQAPAETSASRILLVQQSG